MNKFGDMTADIAVIYEKAKKGHAMEVHKVGEEFGYHPAFKKPGDIFCDPFQTPPRQLWYSNVELFI